MAPTYRDGEWLWTLPVDRGLRRGDVIVFNTPNGTVVKRVALLPGDKHLVFRTSLGWVDTLDYGRPNPGNPRYKYSTVPEGTIFVLGDHLSTSVDSREYGVVKISNVVRIVEDRRAPSRNSEIARRKRSYWMNA